MSAKGSTGGRIDQMRITLKGIRPPIWRRVQVPSTLSLAGFHEVIQTVFGWTDSHLHQFHIAGESYGKPEDFDEVVLDEAAVTLAHAVGTGTKRFPYVYDFGDNWDMKFWLRRLSRATQVASSRFVLADGGNGRRKIAAVRRAIEISLRPSAIRLTKSMVRCSSGWAAVLIRRRLILRQ